jgi:Uma2 family endonuclease
LRFALRFGLQKVVAPTKMEAQRSADEQSPPMNLATSSADIEYPESDGMPMGETDVHRAWMIRLYDLWSWHYRGQRVYVGSDLLLYYTEGTPFDFVVPDDFVVLDSDPGPRRVFKTWEEGRVPNVVFEVTSRATRRKDEIFKPRSYAQIGIKELFLYDPTGDYLKPALRGFAFDAGVQTAIVADARGNLESRELNLLLRLEAGRLVLIDRATGEVLLTEAEAERQAKEAERQAKEREQQDKEQERLAREQERIARQAAEARAAAAEEALRKLREEIARRSPEA